MLVAVAFFIVETLPESRRHVAGHSTLRDRYAALFRDRVYLGAAIIGGMTFTGLFGYLSTSSFLFQEIYAFTAQQYGLLFAVNSIGIIIGVQTSSRLMRGPVQPQWILAITTVVHLAHGDRHHGARLVGRRLLGHRDPALDLHPRVRVLVPRRAGARPRAPRRRRPEPPRRCSAR